MKSLREQYSNFDELKQRGEGGSFLGIPLKDLDRDSLLVIINYLGEHEEEMRKDHKEHVEFLSSVEKDMPERRAILDPVGEAVMGLPNWAYFLILAIILLLV